MIMAFSAMPALAQDALPDAMSEVAPAAMADTGDTAWMLAAALFMMLAILPGLAFSYAGLVRSRNLGSVFVQCFAVAAIASLFWALAGYSLAFAPGGAWLGGMGNAGLAHLAEARDGTIISEPAFALFQMGFAMLAPVLLIGALLERVRFGWLMPFALLWSLFVYAPVARWIWGDGWLAQMGVLDFAGGLVVNLTAGASALVLALLIGKRQTQDAAGGQTRYLRLAGVGLLWVGWLGMTGGAAFGATSDAALAILNVHLAAAASALCWIGLDRLRLGIPTANGLASGALAGFAAAAPAAGQIGALGAILIGLVAGLVCRAVASLIRTNLHVDDTASIFAIHGIGAIIGALLLAPLALTQFGGVGYAQDGGVIAQLIAQLVGVGAVALWSALWTLVLALIISLFLPMRVSAEAERDGLDIASHGEREPG